AAAPRRHVDVRRRRRARLLGAIGAKLPAPGAPCILGPMCRRPRLAAIPAVLVLAAAVAACGGDRPRAASPAAAATPSAPLGDSEPPVPPGSLSRRRLDAALREGPPWL